jgi:hypothetical protein
LCWRASERRESGWERSARHGLCWVEGAMLQLLPATPGNSCSFTTKSFDAGLIAYHKRTSTHSTIGTTLPCFGTKSHHMVLTFSPPWSSVPKANEVSLSQLITYGTATWTSPDKHQEGYPHGHETYRRKESTWWQLFVHCVVVRERKKKPPPALKSARSARTHLTRLHNQTGSPCVFQPHHLNSFTTIPIPSLESCIC